MSHSTPDPDLIATERALKSLAPANGLNRDRLMFEAGRRANRRSPVWPMATGAFAVLSAFFGLRLATEPEPAPIAPSLVITQATRNDRSPPVVHETLREKPSTGLLQLLLYGAPDSIAAEPARLRQINDLLRGGPTEITAPIRAEPARPIELDDLIEPGLLRRGKL